MSTPPDNPKQVYRLTDMSVEEVSVVDRAANRRKFLVVKREGEMGIGAAVTTNADGSLSTEKPAENPVLPPAADTAAPESAAKGLSDDAKVTFGSVVESAMAGLTKAKGALAGGNPEAVLDAVVKVADDLADAVFAYLGIEGDGENAGKPAEGPEAPAGFSKRLEVRRAKRVVAKDAGDKLVASYVAKYGAKMSKDRMTRLQAAHAALGDLLSEVAPKVEAELDKARELSMGHAEAGANGQGPAVMPSVPEKTPAKKSLDLDPSVQALLNSAATTIKKQAQQLGALANAVRESNGAAVEGTPRSGDGVSWPLDMNEPVTEKTSGNDYFG